MKKFFSDFKKFITKGNIIDLAVAVVIGAAFNKIVSSLVNDIIMPLVSLCVGGADVTDWKWIIRKAEYDANGNVLVAETALKYGVFFQAIIDFLIIALTIFIIVKVFNSSRRKLEQIGSTLINETKELTKKQVKAFKKLQKKLSKQSQQIEDATTTLEANNNEPNNENTPIKEDATNKPTEVTPKDVETDKVASNNPVEQNNISNNEMLLVLKEIRDTLKSNNNKKTKD